MCGMQHAAHHTQVSSENPRITALRGITDPVERAAAAQRFILNGRTTLRAAERVRDEAIRAARTPGSHTIDQLAGKIGARRNIIVDALRRKDDTT
jgi:hypothetical protein